MTGADAEFMLALLNDQSWLYFIGDRGVRTVADAQHYILNGPTKMYEEFGYGFCVVQVKETSVSVGICGLAKRSYLEDADIGFALLPAHRGNGYALEAATSVLDYAKFELGLERVLATTRINNLESQRLLEKLGLRFERVIKHPDGDRDLQLYSTITK
jgi:RimJ/RimL family protein N-acetyltransferase